MNILKPYLSSGEIRMIGATTEYEYQEYFSSDDAFRRRFDTLTLKEPRENALQQILDGSIAKYRDLTGVDFTYREEDRKKIFHVLIQQTNDKVRVYNDRQYNPHLVLSILPDSFLSFSPVILLYLPINSGSTRILDLSSINSLINFCMEYLFLS